MGFITLKELQARSFTYSTPNEQARNLVWNLIRTASGRVSCMVPSGRYHVPLEVCLPRISSPLPSPNIPSY